MTAALSLVVYHLRLRPAAGGLNALNDPIADLRLYPSDRAADERYGLRESARFDVLIDGAPG